MKDYILNNRGEITVVGFIVLFLACFSALFMMVGTAIGPVSTSQVGYITAVEIDSVCARVYVKTDLSSSEKDEYYITKDSYEDFEMEIEKAKNNRERVELRLKEIDQLICRGELVRIKTL